LGLVNSPGLIVMERLNPSMVMVLPETVVTDPTAVVTVRGADDELVAPDAAPAKPPAPAPAKPPRNAPVEPLLPEDPAGRLVQLPPAGGVEMLTAVASTVEGEVPLAPAPGVPDAVTQSPWESADKVTVLVWEKVVDGVQSTVVWLEVDCTCMFAPATSSAAIVPDTTGGLVGAEPPEPEAAFGAVAAAEVAVVEVDPPHAARTTALAATSTSNPPGRVQSRAPRKPKPPPAPRRRPRWRPGPSCESCSIDPNGSRSEAFVMSVPPRLGCRSPGPSSNCVHPLRH